MTIEQIEKVQRAKRLLVEVERELAENVAAMVVRPDEFSRTQIMLASIDFGVVTSALKMLEKFV